MLQLKNHSPFKASMAVFPNENGIDALYLTIKATFHIGQSVTVAEQQLPVRMADEFSGDSTQSSLRYANEVHLNKPATDVVVIGSAHAPENKPVGSLDVSVQVGSTCKSIRVFGDRKWYSFENQLRMSPPVPFTSMPIVYERAFGGVHVDQDTGKTTFHARNPVGKGFMGSSAEAQMHGQPLPNLEDPSRLISRPEDQPDPAGFGFLAATWEPRKSFAGTYDEQWQRRRAPYLPEDFQSRFFNAAHPDLVCSGYLMGGEPVTLTNLSENGVLKFKLPTCQFAVAVQVDDHIESPPMNLETVLVEPDDRRLSLLWRGVVQCDKKALKIRHVDIGLKEPLRGDAA